MGAEGTATQFVMAAQPQGGSYHARHCLCMGAGKNTGLQPRAPTLQGGARQQTSQSEPPLLPTCSPWPGLAARCGPGSANIFIWYIPTVSFGEKCRGGREKQESQREERKARREEPAVLTACSKEPLRTGLQEESSKESTDFNPGTCCLLLQAGSAGEERWLKSGEAFPGLHSLRWRV